MNKKRYYTLPSGTPPLTPPPPTLAGGLRPPDPPIQASGAFGASGRLPPLYWEKALPEAPKAPEALVASLGYIYIYIPQA